MLVNIIDNRDNKYCYDNLYGIVESSAHDNSIDGATQSSYSNFGLCEYSDNSLYDRPSPYTLSGLIEWANTFDGCVTLFIYNIED